MGKTSKRRFNQEVAKEQYDNLLNLMVALRQLCKLSQTEASYILGIERSELTKYENGNVSIPLYRFTDICIAYYMYLREKNIPYTERLIKIESLCWVF